MTCPAHWRFVRPCLGFCSSVLEVSDERSDVPSGPLTSRPCLSGGDASGEVSAPLRDRKAGDFLAQFLMRRSRSASLLVKGTCGSVRSAGLRPSSHAGARRSGPGRRERRLALMERHRLDKQPVAARQPRQKPRRNGNIPLPASGPHARPEAEAAAGAAPSLPCVHQRLQLPQVWHCKAHAPQPSANSIASGREPRRHGPAPLAHPIRRQQRRADHMKPARAPACEARSRPDASPAPGAQAPVYARTRAADATLPACSSPPASPATPAEQYRRTTAGQEMGVPQPDRHTGKAPAILRRCRHADRERRALPPRNARSAAHDRDAPSLPEDEAPAGRIPGARGSPTPAAAARRPAAPRTTNMAPLGPGWPSGTASCPCAPPDRPACGPSCPSGRVRRAAGFFNRRSTAAGRCCGCSGQDDAARRKPAWA